MLIVIHEVSSMCLSEALRSRPMVKEKGLAGKSSFLSTIPE